MDFPLFARPTGDAPTEPSPCTRWSHLRWSMPNNHDARQSRRVAVVIEGDDLSKPAPRCVRLLARARKSTWEGGDEPIWWTARRSRFRRELLQGPRRILPATAELPDWVCVRRQTAFERAAQSWVGRDRRTHARFAHCHRRCGGGAKCTFRTKYVEGNRSGHTWWSVCRGDRCQRRRGGRGK